jgi:hypothetical protein
MAFMRIQDEFATVGREGRFSHPPYNKANFRYIDTFLMFSL